MLLEKELSTTMSVGRMQPRDIEIEKAILGAIMLEKNAFERANEVLQADHFYSDAHQAIFQAMIEMNQKGMAVDMLTVVTYLNQKGQIDHDLTPFYVSSLTNAVTGASHLNTHCKIVAELAFKRSLIRIGNELINSGYDESADTFDTLQDAEQRIMDMTNKFTKGDVTHISDACVRTLERIEKLRNREEWITGTPSGYVELDKITCGWQESDLIILAARPACGKTAISLNFLLKEVTSHVRAGLPMQALQAVRAVWQLEHLSYTSQTVHQDRFPHQSDLSRTRRFACRSAPLPHLHSNQPETPSDCRQGPGNKRRALHHGARANRA